MTVRAVMDSSEFADLIVAQMQLHGAAVTKPLIKEIIDQIYLAGLVAWRDGAPVPSVLVDYAIEQLQANYESAGSVRQD